VYHDALAPAPGKVFQQPAEKRQRRELALLNDALTLVNLGLLILNSWLALRQYYASRKQFEYERKPAVTVSIENIAGRIRLALKNQGSIAANNISLGVELSLDDDKFRLGDFTLSSLNLGEETEHDLTEDLFNELEKRKCIHSYPEEMPTGEHDELTNEAILAEVTIYHLRRAHVQCDLRTIGRCGTDINPKPMFSLDYTFHVELNRLDYSGGEDYRYQNDFDTIVTPQTGLWTRAAS
jgi:hypothetical protein